MLGLCFFHQNLRFDQLNRIVETNEKKEAGADF